MPVLSTISRETDEHGFTRSEKFVTERGFELTIRPNAAGLYEIVPQSGGKAPTVCSSLYTSHLKARTALISYINSTDKLGYAQHPDKVAKKSAKERAAEEAANGASTD